MKNEHIVEKMLGCISKISEYTKHIDYNSFEKNSMVVEACVFNLSLMGEYAHKAEQEFCELYPEIPWNTIYGLRNRIVHDYEGVNLILIWEIIKENLPELEEQLRRIL